MPAHDENALAMIMEAAGAFEGYEVSTYKLYRKTQDGRPQTVNVTVLDGGPGQRFRWTVYATSDDGKKATGNPGESLRETLAIVHWGNLG